MERTQSIQQLVQDVETGKVVLPEFQRDFVWEITKTYDLFDSIVKDIFIGAIIYGIPSFEIAVREIDDRPKAQRGRRRQPLKVVTVSKAEIEMRQRLERSNFRLLLDGQQRSTALYRAVLGVDPVWFVARSEGELEIDFEKSGIEELLHEFSGTQDADRLSIKLSDVWRMDREDLDEDETKAIFRQSSYYQSFSQDSGFDDKAEFKKYRYLRKKITELFKQEKLLSYYLLDMSLEKFVVFFERSNTRGVQLNFIDILAAKLYTGNFNLKQKIQEFEKANPNYVLVPETIVRTIAYLKSSAKEVDRNYILTKLKAEDFIERWDELCGLYKKSLDFLYANHLIISQDWMPYENMLIPIIVFVREIGGDFHQMTQPQKDFLVFWYLNAVFSLRYSGATNERVIEDATIFANLALGKKITSSTFFNKLTKNQIAEKDDIYAFEKKGNAVYKGILNLINFHSRGLTDWNNDSKLSLNSELEDHHIFPKAYLDKTLANEVEKDFIDCVGNRTLVPKKLNIKIGANKPSEYLAHINAKNPNFDKTLQNHLIPRELMSGELDYEYKFFLDWRIEEIFQIIQRHLVAPTQRIRELFYEETKIEESSNIPIFCTYHRKRAEATFNPASKKVFYSGRLFDSPSAAASAAKTDLGASPDNTENGWTFWRFVDDNGEERRILELREGLTKLVDGRFDPSESTSESASDDVRIEEPSDIETENSTGDGVPKPSVDQKRNSILAAFGKKIGKEFQKKSRATYATSDETLKIACTISARYEEASYPYWFRYDKRWREFVSSAPDGFLILGCMDLDIAFAIPASAIEEFLPKMNTTDNYRDRESYWHVFVRILEGERYSIYLSKTQEDFDITPYQFRV
ncbi:MAG: DUF262 domain-containing protein [Chloracidobacterium sp.]|nr:DUF262 domain-containing protein [Chloracidobacterium sp.]